jgi:hypothetical protein
MAPPLARAVRALQRRIKRFVEEGDVDHDALVVDFHLRDARIGNSNFQLVQAGYAALS